MMQTVSCFVYSTTKQRHSHDRNVSTPTHAMNSLGSYLLYSHLGSIGCHTDFVLESWQNKICLMSSPIASDVFSHTAPPGNM